MTSSSEWLSLTQKQWLFVIGSARKSFQSYPALPIYLCSAAKPLGKTGLRWPQPGQSVSHDLSLETVTFYHFLAPYLRVSVNIFNNHEGPEWSDTCHQDLSHLNPTWYARLQMSAFHHGALAHSSSASISLPSCFLICSIHHPLLFLSYLPSDGSPGQPILQWDRLPSPHPSLLPVSV